MRFQFKHALVAFGRVSRVVNIWYKEARATSAYEYFMWVENTVLWARALRYRDYLRLVGLFLRWLIRNPKKVAGALALWYAWRISGFVLDKASWYVAFAAMYTTVFSSGNDFLDYSFAAATLGMVSPYFGYRVIWYYSLWIAEPGMDTVCCRSFGDSYLERFVGIDWWEYFAFSIFWPQHFFFVVYYYSFIYVYSDRAIRRRYSFGQWGGWKPYNRKWDFSLWHYLSTRAAACRSPLANNDVVIFNGYWHTYETKKEYHLWIFEVLVAKSAGMRAWVLPGTLYQPDSAGLPLALLYAHEQIVEGLSRRYTLFSSFNSPFNVLVQRLPRGSEDLEDDPFTRLRDKPYTTTHLGDVHECAHYEKAWTAVDQSAGYGDLEPFIWTLIRAHGVFRRTCFALGLKLDYTDWTAEGLLRRCIRDKNSWVYFSTRKLGGSRIARTLYRPEADPFLLAWACAPARTMHPVYGFSKPYAGKRLTGYFPNIPMINSPASAVYDVNLDAAALAGCPGVVWG